MMSTLYSEGIGGKPIWRKIVLNLAISLDGYIADKDGGFDWIKGNDDNRQNTENKFDFDEFLRLTEVVVMGSKAYEELSKRTIRSS